MTTACIDAPATLNDCAASQDVEGTPDVYAMHPTLLHQAVFDYVTLPADGDATGYITDLQAPNAAIVPLQPYAPATFE